MSTTNTDKNATREARVAQCHDNAGQAARVELGTAENREVVVTSALTTKVTEGTKTKTTSVEATVGYKVAESETDSAAK